MKNGRNFGIEGWIDRLVLGIRSSGAGANPAVFFDTGAIIDLEKMIKLYRQRDKDIDPHTFWRKLNTSGLHYFAPQEIVREVIDHHSHYRVNGVPEISHVSAFVVEAMQDSLRNLHSSTSISPEFSGSIGLDAYWASKLAFSEEVNDLSSKDKHLNKKSYVDEMSFSDRKLLEEATLVSELGGVRLPPLNEINSFTGAVILSPDRHLKESVAVLNGSHPCAKLGHRYSHLGYYSTREHE